MSIKVLSPEVVSKIAAGEVIERPASVVKELLENSLDANATQIMVDIGGRGVELIRVVDNGDGISASEAELVFTRHSTSKISSEKDIESIATLGFRGEAMSSISAVSNVSLITCHKDEEVGTLLKIEEGVVTGKSGHGRPHGTTVIVQDLFNSVPARLKFLKSSSTEVGHVTNLVTQYALAYPEVKFFLVVGGKTMLQTPGNGILRDTMVNVYGSEAAQAMLEVETNPTQEGVTAIRQDAVCRVSGLVSPSSLTRSNRNYLSFFVNRRWVQSRLMTVAVEGAYQGMLMSGKHPICALNIDVAPTEVDVNVHPTKSDVRFLNEGNIFKDVQRAVRDALVNLAPVPAMRLPLKQITPTPSVQRPAPTQPPGIGSLPDQRFACEDASTKPMMQLPILRIMGQLWNTYIVAEGPDGMYLIDQHAAHERILFEKIRDQRTRQVVEVQGLLEPLTIEVTALQEGFLKSHGATLTEYGFTIEPFGERTYLLRSAPAFLKPRDITTALMEIIDSLGAVRKEEWQDDVAASLACHGAIKSGQALNDQEMDALVTELEKTTSPRTCPHGRPTMIQLSTSMLEKEFGRR